MLHRLINIRFLSSLLLLGAIVPAVLTADPIWELENQYAKTKIHPVTGELRFIGASESIPVIIPGIGNATSASAAGKLAVEEFGVHFGLTNPAGNSRLIREKNKPGGGSWHRYQQLFNGIPVLAGEIAVNLDASFRLLSMSGEISTDTTPLTKPRITPGDARKIAKEAVAKWTDFSKQDVKVTTPKLWIVDPRLVVGLNQPAKLTWRLEVKEKSAISLLHIEMFIDARSGGILLHLNKIESAKDRETYTAGGANVLPGTLVCDEADPDVGCSGGSDIDADKAHEYAGDTYDFYFTEHGRDSLDDAGMTLISTVDHGGIFCPNNAFWTGTQMVYCDGFAQADDVVGHELTHGMTDSTSNLFYYYQSGAISESLSDMWGEFVDQTNSSGSDGAGDKWELGEDLPIGAIRDMANPPAYGDPDKMSSGNYWTSASDNGGVHANSGVNNKAAYLMTDGGTFNSKTVSALGIGKVADIYYEAQTSILTSGSGYNDLYDALYQACINLISGGTTSFAIARKSATPRMRLR